MSFFKSFTNFISDLNKIDEKEVAEIRARIDARRKIGTDRIKAYGEKLEESTSNWDHDIYLTNKRLLMIPSDPNNAKTKEINILYEDIDYVDVEPQCNVVNIVPKKGETVRIFMAGSRIKKGDFKELLEKFAGRKLIRIVPASSYRGYVNVCWRCKAPIDSNENRRCPTCRMFICSACGACFCTPRN